MTWASHPGSRTRSFWSGTFLAVPRLRSLPYLRSSWPKSLHWRRREILFSEFHLDDSCARVVLTACENYPHCSSARTAREIQPAVAWTDSSITVKFDFGALPREGDLLLQLMGPEGRLSPSFRVNAGGVERLDLGPVPACGGWFSCSGPSLPLTGK